MAGGTLALWAQDLCAILNAASNCSSCQSARTGRNMYILLSPATVPLRREWVRLQRFGASKEEGACTRALSYQAVFSTRPLNSRLSCQCAPSLTQIAVAESYTLARRIFTPSCPRSLILWRRNFL